MKYGVLNKRGLFWESQQTKDGKTGKQKYKCTVGVYVISRYSAARYFFSASSAQHVQPRDSGCLSNRFILKGLDSSFALLWQSPGFTAKCGDRPNESLYQSDLGGFAHALSFYLRRLASGEGIVIVGVCVWVCRSICPPSRDYTPQCRISLSGEGNVLYPVLSSSHFDHWHYTYANI